MSNTFSGPEAAFDFLIEQQMWGQDGAAMQLELHRHARRVLNERGAYVKSTFTFYGGTPGLIGSASRGELLEQGTEPVEIVSALGKSVALRHGGKQGVDIYLLAVTEDGPGYLTAKGDQEVVAKPNKALHVPHVEVIERRHVEAVETIVAGLEEALEPVPTQKDRVLHLPKINRHGSTNFYDKVINLREVDPKDHHRSLYDSL